MPLGPKPSALPGELHLENEVIEKSEKAKGLNFQSLFGAPAENRTPDTLIKSQVLYQLSYRGVSFRAKI